MPCRRTGLNAQLICVTHCPFNCLAMEIPEGTRAPNRVAVPTNNEVTLLELNWTFIPTAPLHPPLSRKPSPQFLGALASAQSVPEQDRPLCRTNSVRLTRCTSTSSPLRSPYPPTNYPPLPLLILEKATLPIRRAWLPENTAQGLRDRGMNALVTLTPPPRVSREAYCPWVVILFWRTRELTVVGAKSVEEHFLIPIPTQALARLIPSRRPPPAARLTTRESTLGVSPSPLTFPRPPRILILTTTLVFTDSVILIGQPPTTLLLTRTTSLPCIGANIFGTVTSVCTVAVSTLPRNITRLLPMTPREM